jgi:hypothetical protein
MDLAEDIAAKARTSQVGLFMKVLPQQFARVSEMMADGSFKNSDDNWVRVICIRVFGDEFMPDAETFRDDDVLRHFNVDRKVADRALDRLVRQGGITENEDGSFSFPGIEEQDA